LCLSSWNRRTFSMAITAWSAKIFSRAICLSVNGRTSVRPNRNHSDRSFLAQQWRAKDSPSSSALLKESRFRKLRVEFSGDVVDMDCRSVDHARPVGLSRLRVGGGEAGMGPYFAEPSLCKVFPVDTPDYSVVRLT